jgi:hypothetical protein
MNIGNQRTQIIDGHAVVTDMRGYDIGSEGDESFVGGH